VHRHCESKYPENKQKKMTKTSDWQSITPARRSVPLRRVKSKAPALRRNHAPHETPSEQTIYTRYRRKAGALLSTRRSGTLRRAGIFDGPLENGEWGLAIASFLARTAHGRLKCTRSFPSGVHPSGVARNARTQRQSCGRHCEERSNRRSRKSEATPAWFGDCFVPTNDGARQVEMHPVGHVGLIAKQPQ
jgi:hypothetical protein